MRRIFANVTKRLDARVTNLTLRPFICIQFTIGPRTNLWTAHTTRRES